MKRAYKCYLVGNVVMSNASEASALYTQSRLGEKVDGKVQYSFIEALHLLKKKKITIYKDDKKITADAFLKSAVKKEPNFIPRFAVYNDLRNRGYIVKTALKFGGDFRVYDKGKFPGEEHAKWIVFPVYETSSLTWHEFAAKSRVAHSTKKNLLIAIVDEESDVTYYEIKWLRP